MTRGTQATTRRPTQVSAVLDQRSDQIFSVALVGLCILPLFIGYYPWGVERFTDTPLFLLGAAGTLALVWTSGRVGSAWLELRAVLAPLAGLLAVLAVAVITSGRVWVALFGVSYSMLGFFEIAAVASLVVSSALLPSESRRVLGWAAAAMLVVEAAAVVSQVARDSVITGTLSNDTYMGQAVTLLLPLVAVPLLRERRPFPLARWYYAAAAAGFVAVVVAEDRASQALVGVWVVWLAFRYVFAGGRYSRLVAILLAASAIVGLASLFWLLGPTVLSDPTKVLGARPWFWSTGWRAFLHRPFLGYGPDGFRAAVAGVSPGAPSAFGPARPSTGFEQLGADPHNLIIWLVICGGLACLGAAIWLVVAIFRRWRSLASAGQPVAEYASGVLLYAGSLLMAPAPLQTLPLFALVLGLSLRATGARSEGELARPGAPGQAGRAGGLGGRWVVGAVVCVGGIACVLTMLYGATRLWVGASSDHVTAADARRGEIAATLWRFDPFLWYTTSLRWGTLVAGGADQGNADISAITRATTLEPGNFVYALEYALTLAFYRYPPDRVESAFQRALETFPDSPQINMEYARYLVHIGSVAEATPFVQRAVELAPDWPDALDVAASYYEAIGDPRAAQQYRERADAARATLGGM